MMQDAAMQEQFIQAPAFLNEDPEEAKAYLKIDQFRQLLQSQVS